MDFSAYQSGHVKSRYAHAALMRTFRVLLTTYETTQSRPRPYADHNPPCCPLESSLSSIKSMSLNNDAGPSTLATSSLREGAHGRSQGASSSAHAEANGPTGGINTSQPGYHCEKCNPSNEPRRKFNRNLVVCIDGTANQFSTRVCRQLTLK